MMRGEAQIEGTKWRLKYDFNALVAVEEVTEKPLAEVLSGAGQGFALGTLRALVWAGLRGDGVTLEQAGDIISDAGLMPVQAALEQALTAAMPAGEPSGNAPKRTRAGTS